MGERLETFDASMAFDGNWTSPGSRVVGIRLARSILIDSIAIDLGYALRLFSKTQELAMAKTLAQLNTQIAELQKKVDAVKAKEAVGVIARIKEAIAHYGLTAADLGLSGRVFKSAKAIKATGKVVARKTRKKAGKKPGGVIRYRDDAGNAWTGHGKRPRWFLAALESGKNPQDLEVKQG